MKSGYDFATNGWVMIILGASMVVAAASIYWSIRRTQTLPLLRESVWPNVTFGIGEICRGMAIHAKTSWNDPESALDWIGVGFILLAVVMWVAVFVRHRRARLR